MPPVPFPLGPALDRIRRAGDAGVLVHPAGRRSRSVVNQAACHRLAAELARYGFQRTAHVGAFRACFLHRRSGWVLKVAVHPRFRIGVVAELALRARVPRAAQVHLVESWDLGGGVVLQPCLRWDTDRRWATRGETRRFMARHGIVDGHDGNVAFDAEGRWVLLDYATARIQATMFRAYDALVAERPQ